MRRFASCYFFFPFLALAFGFMPGDSFAASWSWADTAAGRDRIQLELDNPQQRVSVNRTGPQSLEIAISPAPETLAQTGNARTGNLTTTLSNLDAQGRAVLNLASPAFGYIVAQDGPGRVVVDIFPDPLGARWQPGGGLGPVVQTPAVQAPVAQIPPVQATPPAEPPAAQATPPAAPPVVQVTPPVIEPPAAQTATTQVPAEVPTAQAPAVQTTPTAIAPVTQPVAQPVAQPPVVQPQGTQNPVAEPPTAQAPAVQEQVPEQNPAAQAPVVNATPAGQVPVAPVQTVQPETQPPAQAPAQNQTLPVPAQPQAQAPAQTQTQTPEVAPGTRVPLNTTPPQPEAVNTPSATTPNFSSAAGAATASPEPTQATQAPAQVAVSPAQPTVPVGQEGAQNVPPAQVPVAQPNTNPAQSNQQVQPAQPVQPLSPAAPQITSQATPQAVPQATPSQATQPSAQASTVPPAAAENAGSARVRLNMGGKEQSVEYNLNPTPVQGQAGAQGGLVFTATPVTETAVQANTPNQNTAPNTGANTTQTDTAQNAGQEQVPGVTQTPDVSLEQPLGQPAVQAPVQPAMDAGQNTQPTQPPPLGQEVAPTPVQEPALPPDQAPEQNPAQSVRQNSGLASAAQAAPAQTPTSPATENSMPPEANAPQPDVANATSPTVSTKPQGPPILFVDEAGNPVPPPPDTQALIKDARSLITQGNYQGAVPILEQLRNLVTEPVLREEILYLRMNSLMELGRPDYAGDGVAEGVIQAANEAMNFNLESPRVPSALTALAHVNTRIGHLEDAHGYVFLLRKNYPQNAMVPILLNQLAYKYADNGRYAEAIDVARIVTQEFPNSDQAREAARLVAYSYYKQGLYDKALEFVEFIDRRWPNIYLDYPDYLRMSADMRFAQGKLPEALTTYWLEYNLNPLLPTSADILFRIGEIYYILGEEENARIVLESLLEKFPESAVAPKALLWEGEGGIYPENLTLDEIFAIFEKPNPRIPSFYYQRILNEYPDAPVTPAVKLRLIAWQLWNGEYENAMDQARSYSIDYAGRPESIQAMQVLLRGFAHELGIALSEENYDKVLSLWQRYPQVHEYYNPMEDDIRVALARANLNRGNEAEGLDLLAPFLGSPENSKYGQYAYNIYLASYMRTSNWAGILELGDKVANWNLPQDMRDQLDYALALSAENLGLPAKSLPLWQKLAPNETIPLYQRAYATYFLARDAEARQDLRAAYQYNLDALAMFKDLETEGSPYASPERQRESIAALMEVTEIAGRYAEALEWASEYARFVPNTSPDYAGLRFREARLYRKMGDLARWRSILETIIATEPDSVFGKMAASELRTFDVARDLQRFAE